MYNSQTYLSISSFLAFLKNDFLVVDVGDIWLSSFVDIADVGVGKPDDINIFTVDGIFADGNVAVDDGGGESMRLVGSSHLATEFKI